MRKFILQLCIAGSIILAFQAPAQQTNHASSNAHADITPQVWKTNMDVAKLVEGTVNALRQIAEAGTKTGLPKDFHYSIKEWTQQDVTSFAKCGETFDFFETLLGIGNAAVASDKSGNYTEDAVEAQKALTYLKPNCCKSWKGFCNMIANASDATETLRVQYHRNTEARKKG